MASDQALSLLLEELSALVQRGLTSETRSQLENDLTHAGYALPALVQTMRRLRFPAVARATSRDFDLWWAPFFTNSLEGQDFCMVLQPPDVWPNCWAASPPLAWADERFLRGEQYLLNILALLPDLLAALGEGVQTGTRGISVLQTFATSPPDEGAR